MSEVAWRCMVRMNALTDSGIGGMLTEQRGLQQAGWLVAGLIEMLNRAMLTAHV